METEITPVSKAQNALNNAKTAKQSKEVEAMAAAARAWAKENEDFEGVVSAAEVYIKARRKTTKLIKPNIREEGGRPPENSNNDVTVLADYGFTKMQWFRRNRELDLTDDDVEAYFDDCIEKKCEPTTAGMLAFYYQPHVMNNSEEDEWYTPKEIIEAAREVMGSIDLDPASSDIANETVKAETYYTEEDNGLEQEWSGNVWMNPPYSQPAIDLFSQKLASEYSQGHLEQAVVLVNNATETAWLQRIMSLCQAVLFLRGRVKFIDMNGNATGAPLQGQVILFFDTDLKKVQESFGEMGILLYGSSG